jgi:hypothetical protein
VADLQVRALPERRRAAPDLRGTAGDGVLEPWRRNKSPIARRAGEVGLRRS